jgi:hypothetical protein
MDVLTPAQRAAQTRAGRLAGILPAKPEKGSKAPAPAPLVPTRPQGVTLVLTVTQVFNSLEIGFRFDRAEDSMGSLPEHERHLPALKLCAFPSSDRTTLLDHTSTEAQTSGASRSRLQTLITHMDRLERFIRLAHSSTEDDSFAQTVLALASHLRVDRVEIQLDGTELVSVKRGAAYLATHKAVEAFLASLPPITEQAP